MNKEAIAMAFNQWLDDYTDNPSKYEAIEESVTAHLKAKLAGKEPSYGERCAAVLMSYIDQQCSAN